MNRRVLFTLVCFIAALTISCGKHAEKRANNNASSPAAASAGGVQWPALRQLDELAELAEQTADGGAATALRELGADIKPAAIRVATEAPPKDAHEPKRVKMLQSDLFTLVQSLSDPAGTPEASLRQTLAAFHPIVEQLMEAAGMPHVHEHEGGGEQGHGDKHE